MERYVIRIYHRDPVDPTRIAGTVEWDGRKGQRGFLSSDALIKILLRTAPVTRKGTDPPAARAIAKQSTSYSELVERIRLELESPGPGGRDCKIQDLITAVKRKGS